MIGDILTVLKAASANIAAATAVASKPKASGQAGDVRRAAFIAGLRASKKITSSAGEAFYNQLYDLTGGVGPFTDPSGKSLDIPGLAPEGGGGGTLPPPSVSGSPHMESVAEGGENAQEYTRILGGGGGGGGGGGRRRRRRGRKPPILSPGNTGSRSKGRIRKPPIITRKPPRVKPARPRDLSSWIKFSKFQLGESLTHGMLGTAMGVPLQAGLGLYGVGKAVTRNLTDPNSTPFRAAGDVARAGIGAAGGIGGAVAGTVLGGPAGGVVGGMVGKLVAEPLGAAFGALIALPEKIEAFGAALLRSSERLRQYDPGINMMLGQLQRQQITLARHQALATRGSFEVLGQSQMSLRAQMQPFNELFSNVKNTFATTLNYGLASFLLPLKHMLPSFLFPKDAFKGDPGWLRDVFKPMVEKHLPPYPGPRNLRPGEGPGGRLR